MSDVVEIAPEQRAAILKMLAAGWQPDHVARIPQHPDAAVRAVAEDAGWPSLDKVRRAYLAAARHVERERREREPGALLPSGPPPKPRAPEPRPPEPDPPSPPLTDQPCDVCGVSVAAAYIARTGRARHGHHLPATATPKERTR